MNKIFTLTSLTILLLSACSTSPKSDNKILSYSENTKKLGVDWENGNALVIKGHKLIKNGSNKIEKGIGLIDEGKKNIDEGIELTTRGEVIMKKNESKFNQLLIKQSY
ncbi:MAG: hypothetical protein ACKE51_05740 [Methylococcaceae bacterium]